MKDHYTILVAMFACLGTFLYVVATYIAGEAVGAIMQILIADKLGRLRFMHLQCIIVSLGCAIQTGAVNVGMFLGGRIIAGIAVGALSGTVPIYLSEISPPKIRGLIGGLNGVGLAFGTMTSNWVGFAGGFAPYGQAQWRVPLGLQIPWGIVLFTGLITFMPNSPRQLIQRGRVEEARHEFTRIRSDLQSHVVQEEFGLMKAQIEFELQREIPTFKEIWKTYRRRVLVMLLAGVAWVIVVEIYCAVMQRSFQNTDNRIGKGFAILGIYLFAVGYYSLINPVTWIYGAEVLPISIRSKIMGVAAAAHYIVNVGVTQAGPSAFATIHENYYYVFVGCCSVFFVIIYLYYPETKQKTLEEIAAAFGDRVVEIEDHQAANMMAGTEAKGDVSLEHLELDAKHSSKA
ncbi:hypothetical protein COL940_007310 [Colletotrichum noveboracense]|nr:hypothetical protein COL940_007310 [Colletotrichum noveboracense]